MLERCEPGAGLLAVGVTSKPTASHTMVIPAGGSREPASALTVTENRHVLRMVDGPRLYAEASEGMVTVGRALLDDVGLRWSDIDSVVPHQPNRRLLERLARLCGLPAYRLFVNVERFGNTFSAACGIALDEALRFGCVVEGNRVLLVTGGAGYTAGAALLLVDAALLRRVGVTA